MDERTSEQSHVVRDADMRHQYVYRVETAAGVPKLVFWTSHMYVCAHLSLVMQGSLREGVVGGGKWEGGSGLTRDGLDERDASDAVPHLVQIRT